MESQQRANSTELEKLGYRSTLYQEWPLDKCAQSLSRAGYKSLELCLKHPGLGVDDLTPESISQIKELLDKNSLRLSSVFYCVEGNDFDAIFIEQKKVLETAKQLGCKTLVLRTALEDTDPTRRNTSRNIMDLLQVAEGLEMTIAIETEPGTVLDSLFEFSQLVGDMAGLPIALNLNLGHAALTEGDVGAVIHDWARFIVQAHITDVRRPDHVHLLPGDGYLNLSDLVQVLRNCQYDGDLILDLTATDEAPDQLAEAAIERCKEIFA
jgi:sugar phosphate isomerase/epimerase